MILSVLTLGAVMLGASTIAGFLVLYQIRSSTDAFNSAKAVFAADAGIDWGLYQYSRPTSTAPAPVISNGSSYSVTCYDSSSNIIDCKNASTTVIKSVGRSANSTRAFELTIQ